MRETVETRRGENVSVTEFIEDKYGFTVVSDHCLHPYGICWIGLLRKNADGFFLFYPVAGAEMSCKTLRDIMNKVDELNTGRLEQRP